MAKFFDEIPEWLLEWIQKQHMFWVASAPLSIQGHVNVSPKGTADCFHVVNSRQVWYEDLSGSGVETISHIRENGRVTIMFSAFEGPPRILRLFGVGEFPHGGTHDPHMLNKREGTVHEYGTPEYNALIPTETRKPGSRAAIVVDVYQVGTSCGYAVPFYDFVTHRTQLLKFFDKIETSDRSLRAAASNDREQSELQSLPSCDTDYLKAKSASSPHTLRAYWLLKNTRSLDGLPGLLTAHDAIVNMIPQSRFEEDIRPMKRDGDGKKGENYSQLVFGDCQSFAYGFVSGAVAILTFATVLGKLRL